MLFSNFCISLCVRIFYGARLLALTSEQLSDMNLSVGQKRRKKAIASSISQSLFSVKADYALFFP